MPLVRGAQGKSGLDCSLTECVKNQRSLPPKHTPGGFARISEPDQFLEVSLGCTASGQVALHERDLEARAMTLSPDHCFSGWRFWVGILVIW